MIAIDALLGLIGGRAAVIAALIGMLSFAGAVFVIGQRDGEIAAMKLAAAQAQIAAQALGIAQGEVTITAGVRFGDTKTQIVERKVTEIKEVPIYVTKEAVKACTIPLGFVRLFDSAASGSDAFPLAAGQSNDTVTVIGLDTVSAAIAENFGRCRENAAQLDALNDWIRKQQALSMKR